ncbi:cyclophilin-like fold protein [Faecalicatena acetigenes]|uniref:Cyclophilin-like fold protein n=1 Tax=Faecalicatena acetigenes TaxID=2981790 RepID=A0ABT2TAA4_9FIRM|nr:MULTISPECIES: cyclophilin-like fold protein [Lachnospiraceae]MCU6747212.1 cyclophilin-like fold protein [Faecalicatena acetigenes]
MKMKLEIGDHIFSVVLEENSSVDALKELLADGSLTLHMTDYAGMEKGADLGTVLPQNNEQMHTQAGDIILYQGKTLVIYYDTNSWNLTQIGKIENVDAEELRQLLGKGDVTVTVSIE